MALTRKNNFERLIDNVYQTHCLLHTESSGIPMMQTQNEYAEKFDSLPASPFRTDN